MKKFLVAILAVSLFSLPAMASNDGGKKKDRKKARTERKKDKTKCNLYDCDPKDCDPKNCDPKNCDPNCCQYPVCPKEEKCSAEKGENKE
jgi:hypothetical protein